jgi:hypothetical protein
VRGPQEEKTVKRFVVSRRLGHELYNDGDTALAYLQLAGIPAHLGRPERGHNIIWVEETTDSESALALLQDRGFDVEEDERKGRARSLQLK